MNISVKILTGEEAKAHYNANWKFGVLPDDNILGDTIDGIIPNGEAI